jgi:ribonuclease HI
MPRICEEKNSDKYSIHVNHGEVPPASLNSKSEYWCDDKMSISNATNNIAELYAVALALRIIVRVLSSHPLHNHWFSLPIAIYTDSKYVIGTLSEGHQMKTNKGIIIRLLHDLQSISSYGRRQISFNWIKGHSQVPGNEHVDHLAGEASINASRKEVTQPPPLCLFTNTQPDPLTHKPIPPPDVMFLIGRYPPHLGKSDIARMLTASGRYIHELMKIRRV